MEIPNPEFNNPPNAPDRMVFMEMVKFWITAQELRITATIFLAINIRKLHLMKIL